MSSLSLEACKPKVESHLGKKLFKRGLSPHAEYADWTVALPVCVQTVKDPTTLPCSWHVSKVRPRRGWPSQGEGKAGDGQGRTVRGANTPKVEGAPLCSRFFSWRFVSTFANDGHPA